MSSHVVQTRAYLGVFATLLVLTALTTWVAFIDMGVGNTIVALTIASVKAILVLLIFMHVRWSSRLVQILAATGVLFFFFLISFSYADYTSRQRVKGWEPIQLETADEVGLER
jgi:cytochrome c oxidase subunit 4